MRKRDPADGEGSGRLFGGAGGWVHRTDLVLAAVLLALAGWLYWLTAHFDPVPALFAQGMPPQFFPRLLLSLIAVLALALPFEHLFHSKGRAGLDKGRGEPVGLMAWLTMALLGLVIFALPLSGTFLALVLACALLPVLWGERRLQVVIPYALLFPLAVFLLFNKVLKIQFEPGLVGRLLG